MRVSLSHRGACSAVLVSLGIAIFVAWTGAGSSAGQDHRAAGSNVNRRQSREEFGSSLKRLKWDSKKGTAVETRKDDHNLNPRQRDAAVRLTTLLVTFDVVVVDPASSKFVTGLSKDDFIVSEDGVGQQISTFSLGDGMDLPRRILLIIDTSGSQRACLDASIDAARILVNQLAPKDDMAIATDDVVLAVDFTADRVRLARALDLLRVRHRQSQSLQFTTLFAALREVFPSRTGAAPHDARQIIIFQTDGDEAPTLRDQPEAADFLWNMPRRRYGLSDIYRAAERSRTTIYSVIPSDRLVGIPPTELMERGRNMLVDMERARFRSDNEYAAYAKTHPLSDAKVKLFTERFARGQRAAVRVAELTGGWTDYLETPGQASDIYSRIQRDINNRYVIGYYPANTLRDGKLRQVRIEVRGRPTLMVQGRTSYYAPEE